MDGPGSKQDVEWRFAEVGIAPGADIGARSALGPKQFFLFAAANGSFEPIMII